MVCFTFLSLLAIGLTLLYFGKGFLAWFVPGLIIVAKWWYCGCGFSLYVLTPIFFAAAAVFGIPALRRQLITRFIMPTVAKFMPRISKTERIALDAGTVWWDGDLFSGKPNWKKLLDFTPPKLSKEEQAYLNGPIEELCRRLDDWQIAQDHDLPQEIWDFYKQHKLLGMIIPKEYGGLGFSAAAHSAVITKISSRSITAAVTAMVPNSLGPAELLLHYGTDKQKDYFLPRLADGREIPCFALTGPEAGSDAAATQSVGIVKRGTFEGKEVLGIELTWNKRYITLGPIATTIGLAFRLLDPEHLLGDKEDIGITCALIPRNLPGIDIGKRHDVMGVSFMNGPNFGKNVFVPLDTIIGGEKMAGEGWRMLMDSLAVGRSISLPSLSVGLGQLAARVASAYGMVREQFDTPIGRFEGIEEPMSRIVGLNYMMNTANRLTLGAVDTGAKPSVISAIAKAYMTENMRQVINDAMDIRAGSAICRGPRNILASAYASIPISITVEGANILTRTMIIYGQGAIRCHPFVIEEIEGIANNDLKRFDKGLFGHLGFVASNVLRSFILGLTGGRFVQSPAHGDAKKLIGQLTRMSSAFAIVSDVCMGTLGGQLKRREKISGRLADALAWMYFASATVKHFVDAGYPEKEQPFLHWAASHSLYEIQRALDGILKNLPNRAAAWALTPIVFPTGARLRKPNDRMGTAISRAMLEDHEIRQQLTKDIFIPAANEAGLGRLEAALIKARDAHAVETKIRDAVRAGKLDRGPGDVMLDNALSAGIISEEERQKVIQAGEIRSEVIQVDAFEPEFFKRA